MHPGYDEKVAAFFPCTKQALPQPAEVAIFDEVKRHRALLLERVAALLAVLAVQPQARIRAAFHLVYFCEQLGVTAATTGTGKPCLWVFLAAATYTCSICSLL